MSFERDRAKRKVKPTESAQSLLDFDLEESSDDSDFRIEDHAENSEDYSITDEEGKPASDDGSSSEEGSDSDTEISKLKPNKPGEALTTNELLDHLKKQDEFQFPGKWSEMLICAGCLGTRSDDANEIVECDGCGVTVHEGCYGVSESTSESSTVSLASTEPWFCEACKAGVTNPKCELCPNEGGIFKETEVGAWVHLVCALYIPGVAFSEVDKLTGVTLFEMSYSCWGRWPCQLCLDTRYARTGVSISCDAGLCKTYFHVTCGQREGLLAEAHTEEVDQADPFYANCKMHSDKTLIKKRRKNWLALQLRQQKRKEELENNLEKQAKLRTERKLLKYRKKYLAQKETRNRPWVPTQKMPRMLWTSPSAVSRFSKKAQLMGIDLSTLELQDSQIQSLKDVSRRWHIAPAFSVEFVSYYLERNSRVNALRKSIKEFSEENVKLLADESEQRKQYNTAEQRNSAAQSKLTSLKESIKRLHDCILFLCPNAELPQILEVPLPAAAAPPAADTKPAGAQLHNRMSRPTAAALKMGVGFPLTNHPDHLGKVLSTSMQAQTLSDKECGICRTRDDQHLLATCDTCAKHYHLACLVPPLTRQPKKSKLYGWQCSECDKTSESEPEVMEKKVPRKSRTRYSKDGTIVSANEPLSSPKLSPEPVKRRRKPKGRTLAQSKSTDTNVENSSDSMKSPETAARSRENIVKCTESIAESQKNIDVCTESIAKSLENIKANEETPLKVEGQAPLKLTIKPAEYSCEVVSDGGDSAKTLSKKKAKRSKQKLHANESDDSPKKSRKRSFTSPQLTNTPLMSITPIEDDVAEERDSDMSLDEPVPAIRIDSDASFLSPHSHFTSTMSKTEQENKKIELTMENTIKNLSADIAEYKANRKRRKEKHRNRYSPDLLRTPSKHKHKRKKKSQDNERPHPRITIKIKPIPKPDGCDNPQMFYVPTESNDAPPTLHINSGTNEVIKVSTPMSSPQPIATPKPALDKSKEAEKVTLEHVNNVKKVPDKIQRKSSRSLSARSTPGGSQDLMTECDVCVQPGSATNLVRCDECNKRYHFTCLEPPLNKNPKKRGYSWHCADCDPTDVEST